MRRISGWVAVGAVAVSMLVGVPEAGAATAKGSLTVATVGRDGRSVAARPQAVNRRTLAVYYLTSGKAAKLPKGSYDVIVDVWNTRDSTDTLGAKRVTVSGTTKVTVDARKGRPVRADISPRLPSRYSQSLSANLCVPGAGARVDVWADRGHLYVIPSSLAGVEVAYASTWTDGAYESHSPVYAATGVHRGGLPKGVSTTFRQASMATVKVTARSGPVTGDTQVQLAPTSEDICRAEVGTVTSEATLPYTYTAHVTGGQWQVSESGQEYLYAQPRTFRSTRHYGLTLNQAAWGPVGDLPYMWAGEHRLYLNTTSMFGDSTLTEALDARTSYLLTKSGRKIYAKTVSSDYGATLNPVIKKAGWYTLTATATRKPVHRLPAGALAPKSTLSMHFYVSLAKRAQYDQVRAYLTHFTPGALNSANHAKAGATTTVYLRLQRSRPQDPQVRQLSDSVRKVQTWYSTNGGGTWHTAAVRHAHGQWTAAVPNPKSGTVSLRSKVTDSHGDTTTTTVISAYGVG